MPIHWLTFQIPQMVRAGRGRAQPECPTWVAASLLSNSKKLDLGARAVLFIQQDPSQVCQSLPLHNRRETFCKTLKLHTNMNDHITALSTVEAQHQSHLNV